MGIRTQIIDYIKMLYGAAIGASPTADSAFERIKATDDKLPSKAYLMGSADADGGFDTEAKADIEAEAEDALEAENLDHLLQLDGATNPYPEQCATDSILAKLIAKGDPAIPSTYDCTTDSLQALRDRIDTINTADQVDLDAILADTNELQTDWKNGGRLDLIIDAIKTQADKNKLFAESGTDTQLTIANAANEITIKTFDKATYGRGEIKAFKVDLDKAASGFQTLAAALSTIKLRVYEKIDGTNYRLRGDDGASYTWAQGVTVDKVAEIDEISFSEDMQIRAVLSAAPTGTINLPWLCELNKNMEV